MLCPNIHRLTIFNKLQSLVHISSGREKQILSESLASLSEIIMKHHEECLTNGKPELFEKCNLCHYAHADTK